MDIEYRMSVTSDLANIVAFVDYWLTGGGKKDGITGAEHDFFVRVGQQKDYLAKYDVMLATCGCEIVGWAVKTKKGVLIHLLIAATFRGKGIGGELLRRMNPQLVRSKFDQKSGDPADFYRKHGYVRKSPVRVGKKLNIEIFRRANGSEDIAEPKQAELSEPLKALANEVCGDSQKRKRAIDITAKRAGLKPFRRRSFFD